MQQRDKSIAPEPANKEMDLPAFSGQAFTLRFDIEIFDFHPWDKIDSPSGTALELADYASQGRGVSLPEVTSPDVV